MQSKFKSVRLTNNSEKSTNNSVGQDFSELFVYISEFCPTLPFIALKYFSEFFVDFTELIGDIIELFGDFTELFVKSPNNSVISPNNSVKSTKNSEKYFKAIKWRTGKNSEIYTNNSEKSMPT